MLVLDGIITQRLVEAETRSELSILSGIELEISGGHQMSKSKYVSRYGCYQLDVIMDIRFQHILTLIHLLFWVHTRTMLNTTTQLSKNIDRSQQSKLKVRS